MRSIEQTEEVFKAKLVENTKRLIANKAMSIPQKLSEIQLAVRRNHATMEALKRTRAKTEDPTAQAQVDRFLKMRENAASYLVASARWLVHHQQYAIGLRQMPRVLAVPGWSRD